MDRSYPSRVAWDRGNGSLGPMRPGVSLSKADCPDTPEAAAKLKNLRYPQLVGSLLYLVEASRHDLKVAVGNCAKFMSNFGMKHWLEALHICNFS